MSGVNKKRWKSLTAAVVLALGVWTGSQSALAATAVSGTNTTVNSGTKKATATESDATAVGEGAIANMNGTAVGAEAMAEETSVAIGKYAEAGAEFSVAIGATDGSASDSATADGKYSVALGSASHTGEDYSVAIGGATVGISGSGSSGGIYGIAIGKSASVTADESVALGYGASATAANAVALGQGSVADAENTISVGSSSNTRKIVNVTAGSNTTDAANYGQLVKNTTYTASNGSVTIQNNADGTAFIIDGLGSGSGIVNYDTDYVTSKNYWLSTDFGKTGVTHGAGSTAYGYGANASAEDSSAFGNGAGASGREATAIGNNATVYSAYGVAIGSHAEASSSKAIAIGGNSECTSAARASGSSAVALGSDTISSGSSAMALGSGSRAYTSYSLAIGGATVGISGSGSSGGIYGIAIGKTASVTADESVALGYGASATAANAVALGQGSVADAENTISVGSGSSTRKIVNVTAGSNTTDAANYGQLVKNTTYTASNGSVTIKNNAEGTAFTITGLGTGSVDSKIVRINENDPSQILVGRSTTGADYSAVQTIDVSNGGTNYRKIIGVAAGENINDVANYGQLASNNNGNAYTIDENGYITVKTNANGDAFKLKITDVGAVAANNTGFVKGGDVYSYVSPTEDGTYVKTGASKTTAENLKALDTKIGKEIGVEGVYNATDDVETQISKVAAARIKADQYVSFDTGKNVITDAAGNTLVTFTQGSVSQNNQDMVSGGQVWSNDINSTETYELNDEGIFDVKNNAGNTAFKLKVSGNGSITENNTALITGGTAYAYLNPTDGAFVKSGVSTAANLNALDSAMVKKEGEFAVDKDGKVTVLNNADGTAFTITGLSTADSNIVRVNENDSSQILVGRGDTYANVKTIDVSNGGTNYRKITGVAAGESTNDAANYGQLASNNNGNAYTIDENGYITVKTNANGDAFKLKITDVGAVAANNTGFVKGGDVYSYVSPTEDGTYVKTGASKTTAENLKALDTKIGKEIGVEGVYNATDDVETQISKVAAARIKADQYVSFDTGKNVITDAAGNTLVTFTQGTVSQNNQNMVSGGQVWSNDINSTEAYTVQEDGSVTVKNNAGGTAFVINGIGTSSGTGLVIGDTDDRWVDLSWNSGDDVKRGTNSAAYGYKANASAENAVALGYNANASGMNSVALGSGSIASADNVISVGGGANVATRKIINVTAGSDATDAANYGQLVKNQEYKVAADGSVTIETNVADANGNKQAFKITGIGTGSADSNIVRVNENDSSQILVGRSTTSTDYSAVKTIDVSNGGTNYRKVTGVAAGESNNDAANYGQLAKNTTYTMDNDGTITVATNKDGGTAFKLKITDVGAVAANNTGFVKGGDVYSYVSPTEDGTYVKTGASQTTAENLKALDTKIGKEIGVEGVYNATDDVETQISKVAAARIKADQYVSFDTGKNVITDAAGNTLVTFTQGTVASGNNNMVSGGQVWSNDVAYDEYTMGSDGVITVKKNDTTDAFKLKISGNGTIEDSNAGLITGGTAYAYLNPTDGTFVKSGVSTAANLNALDSAMVKKEGEFAVDKDGKVTVLNNADGTAFTITGLSTADSNIVRVNENDSSQILVGRGDTYANVKTIDVSNGGTSYRKVTGVAAGENTNDVANYGQLASNNNGNAYTMDENGYITVKTNANGDAFKLKITDVGAVAANNTGFVKGGDVYSYVSPTEDGTYVKTGASKTTAENLKALDTKIGKEIGVEGVYNATDDVETQISKVAAARIKADQYVSFDTGKNVITDAAGNTLVTFEQGAVASGNNNMVSGGQVWSNDINSTEAYTVQEDGSVTVKNNAGGTAFVINGIGTSSGTGLVIGDTDDRWVDLSWNSGDDVKRGTNSAAYGYKANASAENAVALGYNANASGMNSVALGSGSIASADNVISVGGGANVATRKIINVTAGSDATDAANYGQLVKNQEYKVAADGSVTIETNVADVNGNKQAFKITGIGTGSADSDIVRVNENDSSQILVGRGDTYANVKTIDVSNGGTNYRKITGVAAGESTNDAANYGQLASNNNGNAYTIDENGYITVKTNANGDAFKLKITDVGAVAANNTGFVKGGDVYSYVSPTEDGTYVKTGASKTTAENLKALDTKIGAEKAISNLYVEGDNLEQKIYNVAQTRVAKDQTVSFESGKNIIKDVAGDTLVTFTQGTVASGNNNMVSGGQVWSNDVAYDEYTMDSDGVITVKKNDTTDAFKLKISGNGTIEEGNTGLITGDIAYSYLNPTDGTFVKSGVSTATNLNALDSAMVKKEGEFAVDKDGKVTVLNNADGTAFTITGLSTADSNIVRVNENDSSQILVGRGDTYANVKTIDVSNGGTNYRKITGVAAGESTNDAANYGQLAKNTTYTMDNDGTITVATNKDGGTAFKLKITDVGAVAANNTGFVKGGDVYSYVSPTDDGTYVKTGASKTTAENLKALDTKIGAEKAITNLYVEGDNLEQKIYNVAQTRVAKDQYVSFDTGKNVITDAAGDTLVTFTQGTVASGNNNMVSGGQVWSNDVAYDEYTMGSDGVITVKKNDTTDAFKLKISGNGSITENNTALITGGTAYAYLNPTDGTFVKSGVSTATNLNALDSAMVKKEGEFAVDKDGKVTVLNNADGTAFTITGLSTADSNIVRVNETDSSQILVGRGDTYANVKTIDVSNGGTNYRKITGVAAGESTNDVANYGQLAKNTTYTMDNDGTITVATNKDGGTAFTLKITDVGAVAANNTGFVKGGDVYSYVSPTEDGTYVKTGASKTTAENLKALDTKIGKEIGVEGVYNATDDVETQISKVAAARIKADQYVSFDTGKNVITDAAGNTLVTFTQGTVSQNNQNMVSGGQVWSNDINSTEAYTVQEDGSVTVKNNAGGTAFTITGLGTGSVDSKIVRINENDPSQILVGRSTTGADYSAVQTIDVSNGGTNYRKITGVAAGKNANDAATVGQLLASGTYSNGTITFKDKNGDDAFTVTGISGGGTGTTYYGDGKTTSISNSNVISVNTNGQVTSDSTGIVTGQTVYNSTVTGGSYSNGTLTFTNGAGNTAFTISGIPSGGGSGTTYSGDGKTISISDNNEISLKYDTTDLTVGDNGLAVKKDGTVTSDSTGIVTGQTVYNSMVTNGTYDESTGRLTFTKGNGDTSFSVAINGTGVIYKGDDKTISVSDSNEISLKYDTTDLTVGDKGLAVKKDGKVENGNEGLVTGGAVYDAMKSMDNQVAQLSDDINKVGAGAAALSALHPEAYDPNDKVSFAVGYGHYKGASAGALGAFFKPNEDTTISLASTVGNGDTMMNMGVSFKLGNKGKKAGTYRSAVDLVQRIDALEVNMAREIQRNNIQDSRLDSQEKRIAQLEADNARLQQKIANLLSDAGTAIG